MAIHPTGQHLYVPTLTINRELPTLDECVDTIKTIIGKAKILLKNKTLEKFVSSTGISFYAASTQEKQRIKNEMKLAYENVEKDLQTKEEVAEDPIPTFALFQKEDKKLSSENLRGVQFHMQREEFDPAFDCYKEALKYTQNWHHYEGLFSLFMAVNQKDKAFLSHLYLIQYQLQDGKFEEALITAEQGCIISPLLAPLLEKLYLLCPTNRKIHY